MTVVLKFFSDNFNICVILDLVSVYCLLSFKLEFILSLRSLWVIFNWYLDTVNIIRLWTLFKSHVLVGLLWYCFGRRNGEKWASYLQVSMEVQVLYLVFTDIWLGKWNVSLLLLHGLYWYHERKPYFSWVVVNVLTFHMSSSDTTPVRRVMSTLFYSVGVEVQALTWSPLNCRVIRYLSLLFGGFKSPSFH